MFGGFKGRQDVNATPRAVSVPQSAAAALASDSTGFVSKRRRSRIGEIADSIRHRCDPSLRYVRPDQQAREFLAALQQEFPAGARLAASDVMAMFSEWQLEAQVVQTSWMAVARHFRAACGCGRVFASEQSRRFVAYVIPPRDGGLAAA